MTRHDWLITAANVVAGLATGWTAGALYERGQYLLAALPLVAWIAWFAYRGSPTSITRQIRAQRRREARAESTKAKGAM